MHHTTYKIYNKLLYYNNVIHTPQKIKMYNDTYITSHGDLSKPYLKISCK